MTVPATTRRAGPYNGNGVATAFSFSFKVFTSADIAVTMADTDGTESLLVLDSDYSVTLNGDQDASPGGSVTYPLSGTPLATGESLVVVGGLDYGQDYDVPTGGNFNPTAMEDALDKQAMRTQQLLEINARSMTLAVTSAANVSTSLPVPEASGLLGWNAAANAVISYAGVAGVAVSSFMATVVAAASAALARAALGFTAIGETLVTAASAAAGRSAISAAASGANNDITSLAALASVPSVVTTELNSTVKLTGAQTVAGAKTFSDKPVFSQGFGAGSTSQSCISVYGANGFGSTANKIRRFTTVLLDQGDDLTYADSAANGPTFTVDVAGVYAITYVDSGNAATDVGLSVNSAQLTTAIGTITAADRLANETTGAASYKAQAVANRYFAAGSVIRPHSDGIPVGATDNTMFTITRQS